MTKKSVTFFVIGLLLNCVSFADFQSEISKFSAACGEESCEKHYSKSAFFHFSENQKIDPALKRNFERISFKQAQVWGDTILEGDYAAEGNTRLDSVAKLYRHQEHIGYLITYSEKAWETGNCLYDGINDATLLGCIEGRIYESSYVSLDFREYFYDSKTMAIFKPISK